MVNEIFKKFVINKKKSIMIGDHVKDQSCAKKSKLKFKFVQEDLLNQIKELSIF